MTAEEFREGMNRTRRENALFWVTNGTVSGIAVGLDSGRGVAILHGKPTVEVPLDGLREDV